MLYFEDALWMRENFAKNAIGTLYFVLGFTGIVLHLVLVSILPEISKFVTRPTTVILTAQFCAAILEFCVVFVPIPAMIAVRKSYFINEVLINVPAFLLVMAQVFTFALALVNAVLRTVRSISSKTGKLVFNDKLLYSVITIAFCFSFYFAVNICAHTTIRRFNPVHLNWTIHEFEASAFNLLAILILAPCQLSHLVAMSNLIYRHLVTSTSTPTPSDSEDVREEEANLHRHSFCSIVASALFDALFAVFLCSNFFLKSPVFSLFHVFLTAYWPFITVLTLDIHVRAALIYRIRGIFQPASANSPIVIRAKKHSVKRAKF